MTFCFCFQYHSFIAGVKAFLMVENEKPVPENARKCAMLYT